MFISLVLFVGSGLQGAAKILPLHRAVSYGFGGPVPQKMLKEVYLRLLQSKAEINDQNRMGETPFFVATRESVTITDRGNDMVKLLLYMGASCSIPDNKGVTPKHFVLLHEPCWPSHPLFSTSWRKNYYPPDLDR